MRLLLDTHVVLWWLGGDAALAPGARDAIAGAESDVAVSAASAWELGIKQASGKLRIPDDLAQRLRRDGMRLLDVTFAAAAAAAALPPVHRDPFDRMLVAQAQLGGRTLVTADAQIARYDVHVLPAGA